MSSRQQIQEAISREEVKWVEDCISNNQLSNSIAPALLTIGGIALASQKGYQIGILGKVGLLMGSVVVGRLRSVQPCLAAAENQFPNGTLVAYRRGEQRLGDGEPPAVFESQEQMPSMDHLPPSNVPQSAPQQASQFAPSSSQSYDDLRRKNREQYTNRRMNPSPAEPARDPPQQAQRPDEAPYDSQYLRSIASSYSDPQSPYAENTPMTSDHSEDFIPPKVRRRRVNAYGDDIED